MNPKPKPVNSSLSTVSAKTSEKLAPPLSSPVVATDRSPEEENIRAANLIVAKSAAWDAFVALERAKQNYEAKIQAVVQQEKQ